MGAFVADPDQRRAFRISPDCFAKRQALLKLLQLRTSVSADAAGLAAGQPDFDTPDVVKQGAVRAIEEGKTRYTPAAGIKPLREKIASFYSERLGVPYNWVNSYVAGDKVYCVHETDDVETILEHARRGGFPARLYTVVRHVAFGRCRSRPG